MLESSFLSQSLTEIIDILVKMCNYDELNSLRRICRHVLRLVAMAMAMAQFYVILVLLPVSLKMGIMPTSGDVHITAIILSTKFAVAAAV